MAAPRRINQMQICGQRLSHGIARSYKQAWEITRGINQTEARPASCGREESNSCRLNDPPRVTTSPPPGVTLRLGLSPLSQTRLPVIAVGLSGWTQVPWKSLLSAVQFLYGNVLTKILQSGTWRDWSASSSSSRPHCRKHEIKTHFWGAASPGYWPITRRGDCAVTCVGGLEL